MWKMFSLDLILQCRMWPGKIIDEEIMSRLLVLMRVVTPQPREVEEEERGLYGHRLHPAGAHFREVMSLLQEQNVVGRK